MSEHWYKKYKKIAREKWGPEFTLWKAMFRGFIDLFKQRMKEEGTFDDPINPVGKMLLDKFINVPKARLEGKPIVMHPFNYGPELFYAMDLEPLMQELFSVGLAPLYLNEYYIDITNEMGYGDNATLCNAQRPLIGAMKEGATPMPDLLFYLSTPCNSLSMTYQVFHNLTGIPQFNIDIPYWAHDPTSEYYDEKTIEYVLKQIKLLIPWLEKKTNREFNPEKFKQTMEQLNKTRKYIMEFNELLRAVPCPVNSQIPLFVFLTMVLCGGTQDAVKSSKFMRDEAAENVKNGIGGIPDEKIRIAWPYTHVFMDNELFPYLEENFGAVTIMDILGFYQIEPHDTSTIDKCFQSLALGTLDFSMIGTCRGPIEYYIDYVIRWVKDYKIDCVILPMQFACKHAYAMARITSEEVREQTGVPTLIFGCDPYDSREVRIETIRSKISDFLTEIVM
jgi:benzoyl-CoA reductase/2-hydroxyglutaryl-CoA dehydratase subunit BcrC/BadD/HgdB